MSDHFNQVYSALTKLGFWSEGEGNLDRILEKYEDVIHVYIQTHNPPDQISGKHRFTKIVKRNNE